MYSNKALVNILFTFFVRIMVDGKYNVPVASVFPPKYFDLETRENLLRVRNNQINSPPTETNLHSTQWVDNKKGVFTYKTRLVSTIATQEPILHSLYTNLSTDPVTLQQQLIMVKEIHPRVRVQHLTTLITVLLRVICDVGKVGFNRSHSSTVTPGSGSVHIRVEAPAQYIYYNFVFLLFC